MGNKRILVVEDEPDLADLLIQYLKHEGYSIMVALDGKDGLERAKEEHPDLIITDVMMPKLDGFHLCRLLKFDANFKNIPIIMLTSRGEGEAKQTGTSVGADAYLTKPFESEELLATIRKLLGEDEIKEG